MKSLVTFNPLTRSQKVSWIATCKHHVHEAKFVRIENFNCKLQQREYFQNIVERNLACQYIKFK